METKVNGGFYTKVHESQKNPKVDKYGNVTVGILLGSISSVNINELVAQGDFVVSSPVKYDVKVNNMKIGGSCNILKKTGSDIYIPRAQIGRDLIIKGAGGEVYFNDVTVGTDKRCEGEFENVIDHGLVSIEGDVGSLHANNMKMSRGLFAEGIKVYSEANFSGSNFRYGLKDNEIDEDLNPLFGLFIKEMEAEKINASNIYAVKVNISGVQTDILDLSNSKIDNLFSTTWGLTDTVAKIEKLDLRGAKINKIDELEENYKENTRGCIPSIKKVIVDENTVLPKNSKEFFSACQEDYKTLYQEEKSNYDTPLKPKRI